MADTEHIDRVYLIFKTHLDLGFTDFAAAVEKRYFEEFIPSAIRLARQLREDDGAPRFIWTTGSWLIYEYLERAEKAARKEAEEAILAGDLVWHAIPFTFHSELADAATFRYGLSLSRRLDERFGRETIAAKMTDVPGHTRAIVPLLAEAGVRFLQIGRNRASCPPDVPGDFVWRHNDGSEIVVTYHHDYGYSSAAPGMTSAIAFAHGRDNHPPQDREAVSEAYRKLQSRYPNAEIVSATLDNYAREIWDKRASLPVVTGELGDTWIHGIASHPERVAAYKAMCRLRDGWASEDRFDADRNPRHDKFARLIMCIPEHTWGIMVDDLGTDARHWEGDGFRQLRASKAGRRIEASWDEQIGYVRAAVAGLNVRERKEAESVLAELTPVRPDLKDWNRLGPGERLAGKKFAAAVDPATGALDFLADLSTGRRWADRKHRLGLFLFENFDRDDFDRFARQYLRSKKTTAWWSLLGFTKLGMDPDRSIRHRDWRPESVETWTRSVSGASEIASRLKLPDEAVERFGAPGEIWVMVTLPDQGSTIPVELRWFDKQPRRLPAACWIGFNPKVAFPAQWRLRKMGVQISPLEVIRRGNRRMHAVEEIVYADGNARCSIEPLDAPLCAPGRPSLTDFQQRQPGLAEGFRFNLWNNVWNTNFPYWHGGDCRFRFEIELESTV